MSDIRVSDVDWSTHHQGLSDIRREVFIVEQNVPEDLEWDGRDKEGCHVLAQDYSAQGSGIVTYPIIGTGRLVVLSGEEKTGHIGRMAIRKEYRRQGIGKKILQHLIELSLSNGHTKIQLNAQLYVLRFYQQAGFNSVGDTFMDAGIPHIKMVRML